MAHWKGVRIGGTKEPIELYDLSADIGEARDIAPSYPDIVKRIGAIMEEARANSEFNAFWPLPDHRLPQVKADQLIFNWGSTGGI